MKNDQINVVRFKQNITDDEGNKIWASSYCYGILLETPDMYYLETETTEICGIDKQMVSSFKHPQADAIAEILPCWGEYSVVCKHCSCLSENQECRLKKEDHWEVQDQKGLINNAE